MFRLDPNITDSTQIWKPTLKKPDPDPAIFWKSGSEPSLYSERYEMNFLNKNREGELIDQTSRGQQILEYSTEQNLFIYFMYIHTQGAISVVWYV